MKLWWEGIRAWYQRRFRGFVAAPKLHGGRGTSWQEHKRYEIGFTCRCGMALAFMSTDLVIRARNHTDDCLAPSEEVFGDGKAKARIRANMLDLELCDCPIVDARHIKICPNCGLGHWNDATPRLADKSQARSHA